LIAKKKNMQNATVIAIMIVSGERGTNALNRAESGINGVESKLSERLLKGPAISPSITGIIAADDIKDVNKKSEFRFNLKNAQRHAIAADAIIASKSESGRVSATGTDWKVCRTIAQTNPPM